MARQAITARQGYIGGSAITSRQGDSDVSARQAITAIQGDISVSAITAKQGDAGDPSYILQITISQYL